jgi:ABC-2 type transport system ATP-binding protein
MVLSSHVLHDVESLCTSVLMLNQGRILYDGTLADLQRKQGGLLRVRVRGDASAFAKAAEAGRAQVRSAGGASLLLSLPPGADTSFAFQCARTAGVELRELLPERETLEQSFLRLLGRG